MLPPSCVRLRLSPGGGSGRQVSVLDPPGTHLRRGGRKAAGDARTTSTFCDSSIEMANRPPVKRRKWMAFEVGGLLRVARRRLIAADVPEVVVSRKRTVLFAEHFHHGLVVVHRRDLELRPCNDAAPAFIRDIEVHGRPARQPRRGIRAILRPAPSQYHPGDRHENLKSRRIVEARSM